MDRVALDFTPDDDVLVITSAGCNALDYSLAGPNHVYAVDMNPRQNALLQLKQAAIKSLDYDDFFQMFGVGYWDKILDVYRSTLRNLLDARSQEFWDKKINFFDQKRRTFYYRGTSGAFARMIRVYVDRVVKVRPTMDRLLECKTVEEQREIYENELKDRFWTGFIKFAMNRDTTLSMLGVPKAQRRQLETQYEGGIVKFVQDSVEAVAAKIPIHDNYFWRVYINGSYTRDCCPEYLKEENFETLKNSAIDKVSTHTDSVQGFLEKHEGQISKFILLDHMDWLSDAMFPMLESEWQAILDRAAPNARIIWRSGGLKTDFIDQVQVRVDDKPVMVSDLLSYNTALAEELHENDRVHTYASFYIADLKDSAKVASKETKAEMAV